MGSLEDELRKWGERVAAKEQKKREARGRLPAPGEACRALQYSDQMSCRFCGLTCDTNDPDPPTCPITLKPMRRSGGPA